MTVRATCKSCGQWSEWRVLPEGAGSLDELRAGLEAGRWMAHANDCKAANGTEPFAFTLDEQAGNGPQ